MKQEHSLSNENTFKIKKNSLVCAAETNDLDFCLKNNKFKLCVVHFLAKKSENINYYYVSFIEKRKRDNSNKRELEKPERYFRNYIREDYIITDCDIINKAKEELLSPYFF